MQWKCDSFFNTNVSIGLFSFTIFRLENMANLTEQEHHKTTEAYFCEPNVHVLHHNIFLVSFNIFLSVTSSLGNVLILIALHKESSLHPPSKLMFRCLAITDLCVGLISQPIFAAELLFQIHELGNLCYYFGVWRDILGIVFSGVSLLTATAISVDRLLALSLGLRYRQVVTVRRVGAFLICFWLVSVAVSLIDGFCLGFHCCFNSDNSNNHTVFNNISLLLHEDLPSPPPSPSSNPSRSWSPRATERRRNSTEHSKIPKDCFCSAMDPNSISGLLSSASFIDKFVSFYLS